MYVWFWFEQVQFLLEMPNRLRNPWIKLLTKSQGSILWAEYDLIMENIWEIKRSLE